MAGPNSATERGSVNNPYAKAPRLKAGNGTAGNNTAAKKALGLNVGGPSNQTLKNAARLKALSAPPAGVELQTKPSSPKTLAAQRKEAARPLVAGRAAEAAPTSGTAELTITGRTGKVFEVGHGKYLSAFELQELGISFGPTYTEQVQSLMSPQARAKLGAWGTAAGSKVGRNGVVFVAHEAGPGDLVKMRGW